MNRLTTQERQLLDHMFATLCGQVLPLSPPPNPPDTDSQKGGRDSIYVNSITGDGS